MSIETTISVTRVSSGVDEVLQTISDDVRIVEGLGRDLRSIDETASIHAKSCMYCGSTDQLSSEHIIPYAWGGTVQIHSGSCEACRLITSAFENFALNDGVMPHVRKAMQLPSRSKHRSAKSPIDMSIEQQDGQTAMIDKETEVPVILGLPLFTRAGKLSNDGNRTTLDLEGMAALAFGPDLSTFMQSHAATTAVLREDGKHVIESPRVP